MDASDGLPFGPLPHRTLHLCIDMQRLFAEATAWHTPWMARVEPQVVRLAQARPEHTIFTRFVPPAHPDQAEGAWRRYFQRWEAVTRQRLDPALIGLIPSLAALVPPARVLDKRTYSPFIDAELAPWLRRQGIDTLVISGAETDVCVLATVLDAVDHGFRTIIARDAICGGSDETHDALVTLYSQRFGQQIEMAPVAQILEQWAKD